MNLENLHSFLTVAREGSISKASKKLHVSQPALSIRLRKLEEEVGFKLLERTWEGVQLTNEGQYFMSIAAQSIQDLNATATFFKRSLSEGTGRGMNRILSKERLTIGIEVVLAPFVVNHIMPELRRRFPEIDCHYVSRPWRSLLDLLNNGRVDVAIYIFDVNEYPQTPYTLAMDHLALFCSPKFFGHINNDLSNASLLKNVPFVLFERYAMAIYDTLRDAWQSIFGTEPKRFHIIDEMTTMMGLLADGQGYTIMPSLSGIPLLEQSSLVRAIPLLDQMITIPIQMQFSDSNKHASIFHHLRRSFSSSH